MFNPRTGSVPARAASRPRLRVIASTNETEPESPGAPEEPAPRTPPRRGHLRVIK